MRRVRVLGQPNRLPARTVTALWSAWIDPVAVTFAELQAQQELEALQRRREQARAGGVPEAHGQQAPPNACLR